MQADGRQAEVRRATATTAYRALVTECDEHCSVWDLQRALFLQAWCLMQFELDKETKALE